MRMGKIYYCFILGFLLCSIRLSAQTYSWSGSLGSAASTEQFKNVATDASGNTYVVGFYSGTMTMPIAPTTCNNSGLQDIILAQYNSSGVMQWYQRLGVAQADEGFGVIVNSANEVYVTGYLQGSVFFKFAAGGNLSSNGANPDIFVAKYSNAGVFAWARGIGSPGPDEPIGLQFDNSGNICVAGYISAGTTEIYGQGNRPTPYTVYGTMASNGNLDVAVVKFSTAGTYLSSFNIGSVTGAEQATALYFDTAGNMYLAGLFYTTVDFDPSAATYNLTESTPQGAGDAFLAKYDATGAFVWAGSLQGANTELINGIGADGSGNVYITGSFPGYVNFDLLGGSQTLTSVGSSDIFIAQYSATDGSYGYAHQIGGAGVANSGNAIHVLSSGDYYVTGYFSGSSVNFNPGGTAKNLSSAGGEDAFLTHYTSSGNIVWGVNIGGSNDDGGNTVGIASDGKIIWGGFFNGAGVDIDPGAGTTTLTAVGGQDMFIAAYNECIAAAITTQPVATQTLCTGQNATFSVVASGTGLTYQWKKGGTALTNGGTISGATSATLTITGLVAGDAATYTVDVIGCTGTVTSSNSVLTVPAGAAITTQPVTTQSLCTGVAASMSVTATGSGLTYQWKKGGVALVNGGTLSGVTTAALNISSLVVGDAGNYTVDVTAAGCGTITSSTSVLNVNTGAAITSQPVATQTLCAGSAASMSVTATGTSLTYQWKKGASNLTDGGTITGSLTSSLNISSVVAGDAANYTVVVSSTCGTPVTSAVSALTVNTPVSITSQPAATQTLCTGNAAAFSLTATGSGLTYQWQKGGSNVSNGGTISGATTSSLAISSLVSGDAGNYTVIVSGVCGAPVTSLTSVLNVNSAAAITTQPVATQTLCVGSGASMSVTATGTSLTYQWKKGGVALVNGGTISGATTATLNISSLVAGDGGNYTVDVTASGCGSAVTSSTSVLNVNTPVSITSQPAATQTLCTGNAAAFSVTATGSGLTYQWQKGGSNVSNGGTISGATTSSLAISSLVSGDAGNYTVIVSGSCGAPVTSTTSVLNVNSAAAITTQPVATQTLCTGVAASFSVTATGTSLTYQWKKGGVALVNGGTISGATTATLNISSLVAGDGGNYTVDVTASGCGSAVTSSTSVLNVNTPVSITSQPVATQTLCTGNAASFSVTATGSGLTYQWQKGGSNVSNGGTISGATTSSLAISSLVSGDAGNYTVIVSGSCGAPVTSSTSVLNVNTGAAITSQPVATQTLCVGSAASMSVTATGTSLTYQWKKGGVALVDGGTISGATAATLNISSLVAGDGGNYTVDVTASGCGSAVTSSTSVLNVNTLVSITSQPVATQNLCTGNAAAFSVTATGSGLTYQWQLGGVNVVNGGTISGATTSSLAISSLVSGDAGNYTVIVSGVCGAPVTSLTSVLNVNSAAAITTQPVATQTLCTGVAASFSVTATGTSLTYQWKKGGVALVNGGTISGATTATLNISSLVAGDGGNYTVDVTASGCGSAVTSSTSVLNVNTPVSITSQPVATQTLCTGNAAAFSVTATGSGVTYQWQLGGVNVVDGGTISGATTATLNISSLVSGDAGNYTVIVSGSCGTPVTSTTSALTVNTGASITTQPVASQTLCAGSPAAFSVTATGSGLTYQWQLGGVNVVNGGTISGATTANLNISSVVAGDAGNYTVDVSASGCGVPLTSTTSALVVNTPVSITSQPVAAQTLCTGNAATFSVTATGSGVTYQWQLGGVNVVDGGTISGATTATLNISSLVSGDAGNYTVIVSGSCGSPVTSTTSVLTVNTGASITTQPVASQTLCSGTAAVFGVTATGTGLTYQWKKGGTALIDGGTLTGSTTATLNISSVVSSDGSNYTVDVSAPGCGVPLTSTTSALIVNNSISITTQPIATQTLCSSQAATIQVVASGSGLSYQWNKGGTALTDGGTLTGSLTSTLNISSVATGDAGNYTVSITGTCGSPVTSNISVLSVSGTITITSQPTDLAACLGSTGNFDLTASGAGLTYQWQKNGVNLVDGGTISGALTSSLVFSLISATDAAAYVCQISGSCGTPIASNTVNLTVGTGATITKQPVSAVICLTQQASFSCLSPTATSFQWQFKPAGGSYADLANGANVSGVTTNTLVINNTQFTDRGNYRCVVGGGSCSGGTFSAAASLSFQSPSIVSQPLSQSLCKGQTVTFGLVALGNNLTYQWVKTGVNMTNGGKISGVHTATLKIANIDSTDQATYYCVVQGLCPPPSYSDNVDLNVNVCTAIADALEETLFNIYPNPSTGIYYLDVDMYAAGSLTYDIFNTLGEHVASSTVHGEGKVTEVVDLSTEVSGVYIIRISYADKQAWQRLVIEK
jgi:hypothetical protein